MHTPDHSASSRRDDHRDRGNNAPVVTVTLNGAARKLRSGSYTGRQLRDALDVPAQYELDQVIDKDFRPIADSDHVVVKGGECFVSHCGQGASS